MRRISWPFVFFFSFLPIYWAYLTLTTQPVLVFDAVGYEYSGATLLHQGWRAYYQGLNREPLFPFLVSRAMALGEAFSSPYYPFLKGILFVFLAVTLAGIYRLARLLGASRKFAAAGAFYAGVSPAIVNSALWLWSEAAGLPWAVWGVFFFIKAWRSAVDRCLRRTLLLTLLSIVCFGGLFLVKAASSVVILFYGAPLVIAGGVFLWRKDIGRVTAFVSAAVIFLGIFVSLVEGYKLFNFKMNGNYTVTTRVESALFGNTVRRLQPLTPARIAQAVLSVPRLGLCERYYGRACVFWGFPTSDAISGRANDFCEAQHFSPEESRKFLLNGSFDLMKQHPFQQAALSALEGTKMLFWENRVYFVRYPAWLARIYSHPGWVPGLCFIWALLSLAALIFAVIRWSAAWLLTASFVFWFTAAYSIFFIDIRYGLPIAPLFIAMVAAMFGGKGKTNTFGCISRNAEV
ncbi:MAG: hypothetical protein HQL22_08470 [Candidatus Omnitrophica bacterium]|nr:hypothetical protein [Candidatus Omnitrophota bacterium]